MRIAPYSKNMLNEHWPKVFLSLEGEDDSWEVYCTKKDETSVEEIRESLRTKTYRTSIERARAAF